MYYSEAASLRVVAHQCSDRWWVLPPKAQRRTRRTINSPQSRRVVRVKSEPDAEFWFFNSFVRWCTVPVRVNNILRSWQIKNIIIHSSSIFRLSLSILIIIFCHFLHMARWVAQAAFWHSMLQYRTWRHLQIFNVCSSVLSFPQWWQVVFRITLSSSNWASKFGIVL